MNSFPHHFGNISAWPDDMAHLHCGHTSIGSSTVKNLYLGSLAAVRCLDETKGQPQQGWEMFLSGMSVEHVFIDVGDPRTKSPGQDVKKRLLNPQSPRALRSQNVCRTDQRTSQLDCCFIASVGSIAAAPRW